MSGRKRTWEAISYEFVMTAIALIALVVIIAPSLVVLIVSFTSGFSLRFPPPGYSARWYVELWDAWQLHFAARNSFVISPKGEVIYAYSDMNPNDHVANTMAVVKKYKETGGKKG